MVLRKLMEALPAPKEKARAPRPLSELFNEATAANNGPPHYLQVESDEIQKEHPGGIIAVHRKLKESELDARGRGLSGHGKSVGITHHENPYFIGFRDPSDKNRIIGFRLSASGNGSNLTSAVKAYYSAMRKKTRP